MGNEGGTPEENITGDSNVSQRVAAEGRSVIKNVVQIGHLVVPGWMLTILMLVIISVGAVLYFTLRPRPITRMAGDFRIAVSGFVVNGNPQHAQLGMELAQDVSRRLSESFPKMNLDFAVTVWGPDQTRRISGKDRKERAASAAQVAQDIGADMLVYGVVEISGSRWTVTPEFLVASPSFYDAEEVYGQHEIGDPFTVIGTQEAETRIEINDHLQPRAQVLSMVSVGLARYSRRRYDKAIETFRSALDTNAAQETGMKQLLFLLLGNATGKSGDIVAAEKYYTESIMLNPQYARAYAGRGNVRYLQANSALASGITDTASSLLAQTVTLYQQALSAADRPAESDIDAKAHFGLGRAYFSQADLTRGDMYPAAQEFKWVAADYEHRQLDRLVERVAESHAFLGWIYYRSAEDASAIAEFERAIKLTRNMPLLCARQVTYYDALSKVYSDSGKLAESTQAQQKATQLKSGCQ